jgi:KTSC domain
MEAEEIQRKLRSLKGWVKELEDIVPQGSILREFLLEAKADLSNAETIFAPVQRKEVQSTTLKSFGYNPDAKVLEVEFNNESIYRYYKVPYAAITQLEQADSVGKVFSQVIRSNNNLPYEKIKDAKPKEKISCPTA